MATKGIFLGISIQFGRRLAERGARLVTLDPYQPPTRPLMAVRAAAKPYEKRAKGPSNSHC
jgi:hypothetical protein